MPDLLPWSKLSLFLCAKWSGFYEQLNAIESKSTWLTKMHTSLPCSQKRLKFLPNATFQIIFLNLVLNHYLLEWDWRVIFRSFQVTFVHDEIWGTLYYILVALSAMYQCGTWGSLREASVNIVPIPFSFTTLCKKKKRKSHHWSPTLCSSWRM